MLTMMEVNLVIACAGGKELSTRKSKKLGGNAEKEARAIYEKEVAALNAIDHAPSPDTDAMLGRDAMNTNPKSSTTNPQASNEFWQSILPDNFHMLEVAPDGNCLFCCILDQFNHDGGARHEFMHHQITNHISRDGKAFKIFSYSGTIMRMFLTLMGTFKKWARMVHGEATQRCTLQPGFTALTSLFMQRSMLLLVGTLFSR
jgi:hypothetical protein